MTTHTTPMIPLERSRRERRDIRRVLRRLLKWRARGRKLDPWLPFPQGGCTFTFGPEGDRPLPIGALFLLWDHGDPWIRSCSECGAEARAISFGALLSGGGPTLVCTGCGRHWLVKLGGLLTVGDLADRSGLKETQFRIRKGIFGAASRSDGAELRRALRLSFRPLGPPRVGLWMVGVLGWTR